LGSNLVISASSGSGSPHVLTDQPAPVIIRSEHLDRVCQNFEQCRVRIGNSRIAI
jgi:hypothetical protein